MPFSPDATAYALPPSRRLRRVTTNVLVWLAILLALAWTLAPFYWALVTSVKPGGAIFGNTWLPWVQFDPTLRAWRALFRIPDLDRAMWHSVVVSVSAATISTGLAVPAAYAIALCPWPSRWRVGAMFAFMGLRLMPPVALVTPYLLLTLQLGLRDTLGGLIFVNSTLNTPFALVILIGVFLDLPKQLEEASWVDGSTRFSSFARILLPLVMPAVAASWVLCFAFTWNESLFASALVFREARSMPELVLATGGGGGVNFGAATTRSLILMVFPVVASLFTQRYIVRGLSLGAVKG